MIPFRLCEVDDETNLPIGGERTSEAGILTPDTHVFHPKPYIPIIVLPRFDSIHEPIFEFFNLPITHCSIKEKVAFISGFHCSLFVDPPRVRY